MSVCSTYHVATEQNTMTMSWMVTRVPCPRQILINIKQQLQQSGWYNADRSSYPTRIISDLSNNVVPDALLPIAYLAEKTGISLTFFKIEHTLFLLHRKFLSHPQNLLSTLKTLLAILLFFPIWTFKTILAVNNEISPFRFLWRKKKKKRKMQ